MDEWSQELAGEVPRPSTKVLPYIPSRAQVKAMLACPELTPVEQLALATLYASGILPDDLTGFTLDAGPRLRLANGRRVALDHHTRRALQDVKFPPHADQWLARAARATGLSERLEACARHLTLRILRHAFAVHALEGGMDVLVLSQLLGHRDLRTTERYIPAAIAGCRAAYRRTHPLVNATRRPPQSHLSPEEMHQLIASPGNLRDRLMLRALWSTALRATELVSLAYLDLDPSEGRVFVRNGKDGIDRYTLIDPETVTLLLQAGADQPLGQRIFQTTRAQLFKVVKRAGEATGLLAKQTAAGMTLSPHSFRFSYASECYARGMPLEVLRKLLGHADLKNTLIYTYVPPDVISAQYANSTPTAGATESSSRWYSPADNSDAPSAQASSASAPPPDSYIPTS